ncbi:MAG: hypothetical protein EAZ92_01395 [Candidatus Kapaibacterium sp.]|nr:MAG: hypothetical protein EAZ92_01395 [Candidatus Kapabacteria bacterium]
MEQRSPENELAFIRNMMMQTRRRAVYSGLSYIAWGIYIAAAATGAFLVRHFEIPIKPLYIWLPVIAFGWVFTILHIRKTRSQARIETLAGRILAGVWTGLGIILSITGFIGGSTLLSNPNALTGVMCLCIGLGFYITGILYETAWLRWYSSLGWWAGALLLFCFPSSYFMLILAALMLLFHTVPGIVLYRQWKAEYPPEAAPSHAQNA